MLLVVMACADRPPPSPPPEVTATTPTTPPAPTVPVEDTGSPPTTTPCDPATLEIPCDGVDQDCDGLDVCHPPVEGLWSTDDAEVEIRHDGVGSNFAATVAVGDLDGDGADELWTAELWDPATSAPGRIRSFAPPFTPPVVYSSQAVRKLDVTVYPVLDLVPDDLTGDGAIDLAVGLAGPSWEPGDVIHVVPGPIVDDRPVSALAVTTVQSTNSALYTTTADVDGDGNREVWWSGWGSIAGSQTPYLESPVPAGTIDQATLADHAPYGARFAVADDDGDGADTAWFATTICYRDGLLALDHLPVGVDPGVEAVDGLGLDLGDVEGCVGVPFGPGDVTGDGYDDVVVVVSRGGPYEYVPSTLSVLDGPLGVDSLRQPWQLLEGAIGSNTLDAVDLDASGITDLVFESAGTVLVEASPGGGRVDDLAIWRFETTPWDTARVPDTDHDGLDELLIGDASSAWLIFGAP